jgi:hypothetical protein
MGCITHISRYSRLSAFGPASASSDINAKDHSGGAGGLAREPRRAMPTRCLGICEASRLDIWYFFTTG